MSRTPRPRHRCAAVWAAATGAAGTLEAWLLAPLLAGGPGPSTARFDAWLVTGCAAVAVLVVAWLWVLVTLVTVEAARGQADREVSRTGVPAVVRRLVLTACGVGLAGGLVAPAYAGEGPSSPLTGLVLPDRPTDDAAAGTPPGGPDADRPAPASSPAPALPRAAAEVRVSPGDSLWALARAQLPPGAEDAEVDRQWRAIHAANHEVVGDDPDLILPGQRLALPRPPAHPPSDPAPPAT